MKRTKQIRTRKVRDGGRHSEGWKVWNKHHPEDPILADTGYVIHHKDHNPFNNSPHNLQKMTHSEHSRYHATGGRNPLKGKKFSKEHREKISAALKGHKAWNKGIPLSEEHKRKVSISLKGIPKSEAARQKQSESMRGKPAWNRGIPLSEDHKRRLSESKRGRPAWNKGIPRSEWNLRTQV